MRQIEEHLMKELETFTAFARRRVGDPHLAADVVQDSLLKAVKSADQLRDNESVTA
jgi:DNA-directed RNA polymerase specialized sigma24 family protein